MSSVLAVTAAVAWLALPGVLVVSCLPQYRLQKLTCWILGTVLGLAVASVLQVLCSYGALSNFTWLWAAATVLAAGAWWTRGRTSLLGAPDRLDLMAGTLFLALAAVRVHFLLLNELPNGWDPSFHCLLAEKIFLSNAMIFDWRPFEDISLNYPVAGFVEIAWVKQLTGLETHIVHKILQALHNVLTSAVVYLIAARVGNSRVVGLWSSAVFGFWALAGNLQYFIYGGFPNQLGMLYILAAYVFLSDEGRSGITRLYASCLFAAVFLTHHHVLLSTFLVVAMLATYALYRGDRRTVLELVGTVAGGAILSSFYLLPYALKVVTLGNTSVATYPEEAYGPMAVVKLIGPLFLGAIALGLWQATDRGLTRAERQLLAVAGCLCLLFVGLDWVARYLRWVVSGQPYGLFTPWRFLCNATPFLAYFAGSACHRLSLRFHLPTALGLMVVALASLTNLSTYRELWNPNYGYEVLRASRYLKENTPNDTLVLTPINWVPYLSQRRTALSPLPSSEPSNRGTDKRQLVEQVFNGQLPSEKDGPMICDLRYGNQWPGTEVLWEDPLGDPGQRMVVVRVVHPSGILPMSGWSLDPW